VLFLRLTTGKPWWLLKIFQESGVSQTFGSHGPPHRRSAHTWTTLVKFSTHNSEKEKRNNGEVTITTFFSTLI
jgi:hypothetical protein